MRIAFITLAVLLNPVVDATAKWLSTTHSPLVPRAGALCHRERHCLANCGMDARAGNVAPTPLDPTRPARRISGHCNEALLLTAPVTASLGDGGECQLWLGPRKARIASRIAEGMGGGSSQPRVEFCVMQNDGTIASCWGTISTCENSARAYYNAVCVIVRK